MAAAPVKSPLHDFPLTFLKWNTRKDRRNPTRNPNLNSPKPDPEPEPEQEAAPEPGLEPEPAAEEVEKRNLRPRRKVATGGASGAAAEGAAGGVTKVVDAAEREGGEKRKFWIALSKDEIEEDIYALTGSKPSRRPRKHPKAVQKYLDNVFPGLWLVGLTPDSYRSFDPPPKK